MSKAATKWYSIISGTVFLLLLFIFYVYVPCPTNPQLNFFRIIIALAGGSFAATIPGTFNVKKTWLTATSSLGVFAIIYLINPAGWNSADCDSNNFTATVYIDDKLVQGVEISIPDIRQRFYTDEFGSVIIPYSTSQIKFPTTLIFKYKSDIDTTIRVDALQKKMEFRLTPKLTGSFSIEGNSVTYSYKDLTVNLSLVNQIAPKAPNPEEDIDTQYIGYSIMRPDTVTYSLRQSGDTILVTPNSKLLDLLASNKPVLDFDDVSFQMNLPQFDIKITNNSSDAVFFNQLTLQVEKSAPDNRAIFLPISSDEDASLYNVGWGEARNISIDFSTSSKPPDWSKPFEDRVEFQQWASLDTKSLKEEVYKNLIRKGVDEQYLRNAEYGEWARDSATVVERYGAKAKEFLWGAYIYGTITYIDQDSLPRTQKFQSYISLGPWPGGAQYDFSWKYNTELKTKGDNYTISIPMSNGLKPKDFDRIALTFSAAQSSSHCFYLIFHYDNKEYKIPYPFKMEYFIRAGMNDYLAKVGNK